ncbi:FIG022979: MoxR-like ATPases [hydrothermal vent metagenome]|uniref:FIG022979: MoxR-like ATPases n=1 Tax=hydrothermal vent metagenome TaxID=652676 RepID=A0A3B0T9C1_9ZZZZ
MNQLRTRVIEAVEQVVVEASATVDVLLMALSVEGHVLIEGPPGVAKTLVARTVAAALGLDFGRIQFTPDMLPSDITGTLALDGAKLSFRKGPIFHNAVLADEINRTPPKTQSALLEGMQEGHVTVDGVRHPLPDPFLVVATQNPIEYEGTYPLPEAQLDRFLFKLVLSYPSEEAERALLALPRSGVKDTSVSHVKAVATSQDIASMRTSVATTRVSPEVIEYVASVVRFSRQLANVEVGASPRAGVHLLAAAKAAARLIGRDFVTPDDVKAVANIVLAHRIIIRPEAELDRYSATSAVSETLDKVPVPK